jgi:hypothetical protein
MSPRALALLIVGIVAGVGAVIAMVLIPLFRSLGRKSRQWLDDLHAELALSGERIVLGPESGSYRGGTGGYSVVRGNATLVLTDRRVLVRKVSGGVVEIPRHRIVATREAAVFLASRIGGKIHLIIVTDDPAEVGCFVADRAAWAAALVPPR